MIQSFVSMGWTTVLWYIFGYSLCFSGGEGAIIGNLKMAFLKGVTPDTVLAGNNIPLLVFIAYQMMFAIITPALITGAFANRVHFKAYMLFLTAWLVLVYFPMVHMVWGGGLLQKLGVLDFAGGIVVHAIAGMAALASILFVGRRKVLDKGMHSIPLIALGTGLLWFGWYGFNAGSELRADRITALAFLNTDIAASFAAVTWLLIEWLQLAQAQVRRAADGRRGRPGHDHAGGRLRDADHGGLDRPHRRPGLLLRRGPEEQTGAGMTPSMSGAFTESAGLWESCCSASSLPRRSMPPERMGCSTAERRFLLQGTAGRGRGRRRMPSSSPTPCSG